MCHGPSPGTKCAACWKQWIGAPPGGARFFHRVSSRLQDVGRAQRAARWHSSKVQFALEQWANWTGRPASPGLAQVASRSRKLDQRTFWGLPCESSCSISTSRFLRQSSELSHAKIQDRTSACLCKPVRVMIAPLRWSVPLELQVWSSGSTPVWSSESYLHTLHFKAEALFALRGFCVLRRGKGRLPLAPHPHPRHDHPAFASLRTVSA
jgi:hypothetical protein